MRLNAEQDWPELAKQAVWSANVLARLCGVSERTLRRFFIKMEGKTLKIWLLDQQQKQAVKLLRGGASVKETAFYLGYKQQTNFTRKYKIYWGMCPSRDVSK